MIRVLGVSLLCVVLTVSLFGANLAIATDRGPMDEEFVTSSAEEAGLYPALQDEVSEIVRQDLEDEAAFEGMDLPLDQVVEDTVTVDWIQAEVERNTADFFVHLDGEDELVLYLDVGPLQENAREAIRTAIHNLDYAELGLDRLAALQGGPDTYEEERLAIRSDLLADAGFDRDDGFGNAVVAAMIADEESYAAERSEAREAIADEIVDRLDIDDGFGHERLEAMLESEEYYRDQQDSVPDDRADEVREETEAELRDLIEEDDPPEIVDEHVAAFANLTAVALTSDMSHDEFVAEYHASAADMEADIQAYVDENAHEFADEVREEVDAELAELDPPEALEPGLADLADLTVEGLTTEMSHAEFVEEYDTIADDLEAAAAEHLWENSEDYQDEIDAIVQEEVAEAGLPDAVVGEAEAFGDVVVEAALTDMAFDEFAHEIEEVEGNLADAVFTETFGEGGDRFPDRLVLVEETDDDMTVLRMIAGAVGLLALALPAVSVLLAGGVYLVSRDVGTTAISLGVAAILGGGGSYVLASLVPSAVAEELFEPDHSENLAIALEAFVHALFAPLAGQSLVLLAGGVIVTVGGLAYTFDLPARVQGREGRWPGEMGDQADADEAAPADDEPGRN